MKIKMIVELIIGIKMDVKDIEKKPIVTKRRESISCMEFICREGG